MRRVSLTLSSEMQVAEQALKRWPDRPGLYWTLYQVAFLENNAKGMEAQLAALSGRPGEDVLLSAHACTNAWLGRLKQSREFSRRAVAVEESAKLKESVAVEDALEALREAESGNSETARQTAAAALAVSSGRNARALGALAFARSGDEKRGRSLCDDLNLQFPDDTLLHRYWLPTIRAAIELDHKNPAGALSALQAVSYELSDISGGNLYPAYLRGQAYLMARQGKEAAVEFQKLLDHRGVVVNSPWGALARLGIARANPLSGNTEKSRAAYQDFFGLWKDADGDIPILRQAKAKYAKLKVN